MTAAPVTLRKGEQDDGFARPPPARRRGARREKWPPPSGQPQIAFRPPAAVAYSGRRAGLLIRIPSLSPDREIVMRANRPRGSDFKQTDIDAKIDATSGLRARVAAQQILADVLVGGHALDERFEPGAVPNRLGGLDDRDRALTRSIVTAAVRRLGALRKALGVLLERGLPRNSGQVEWILLVGLTQILFLDTPDHAAVDLAVRAARLEARTAGLAGLVNAALRNAARRRDELLALPDPLVDETPLWLAQRWRKAWGARAALIAEAHLWEPTLDLTVRGDPAVWAERLGGVVLPTGSVRLIVRTPIPDLEGYDAGEFWVQDAAAAIPARLLRPAAGLTALDLCAAPGGKTAVLAAEALAHGALLEANELSPTRAGLVRDSVAGVPLAVGRELGVIP